MHLVIAPDTFKESASAAAVAEAMARGWRRVFPEDALHLVPMADGGEGTVEALVAATGGRLVEVTVCGPAGEAVQAVYGILGDGQSAVIEMAAASGLPLVPPGKRNPRFTTTRGTGELLCHALDAGMRRILLGVGGSATNDGGAGMAQALGYALLGTEGLELEAGGAALIRLAHIDATQRHPALDACEVLVACDVNNPLCGPTGASHVYGPQKGATPPVAAELDAALGHFADVIEAELGIHVADVPGAGAAGGLAAGLMAFAGGQLRSGVELVAEACGLEKLLQGADLVLTGEGCLDAQSIHGKSPVGVARLAKRYGVPVLAIAGCLGPGYERVYDHGIDAAYGICAGPMTLTEAIAQTEVLLSDAAEAIARTWRALRD